MSTAARQNEASVTDRRIIQGSEDEFARALSELFVELDVEISGEYPGEPLTAEKQVFGDLDLVRTRTENGSFSVIRSPELVERSTLNSFYVACILGGGVSLSQESRSIALVASDLTVLDSNRPYRIDVRGYLDALWVRVPRHRVEGRMPRAAEILAQRVDGSSGTGHLVSSLITASLREASRLSQAESMRISNAVLDLLSLSLEVTGEREERRPNQLLRRIQNHIDTHLADPSLNRDSIASSQGISTRYLNKLFEREGLSVAKWIRLRRLELSRQRIEAADSADRTISEIAMGCGFNDVSSFNRAFRRHFGATPTSLRQDYTSGGS